MMKGVSSPRHAASWLASSTSKPPPERLRTSTAAVRGEEMAWSREVATATVLVRVARSPSRSSTSKRCTNSPPSSSGLAGCRLAGTSVRIATATPILLWVVRTRTTWVADPGPSSAPETVTSARCRLDRSASTATFELVMSVSQPLRMPTRPPQPTAVTVISSAARCGSAMETSRRWTTLSCRPASSSRTASRVSSARFRSRVRRSLRSRSPPSDHHFPPSTHRSSGSQSGMFTMCSSSVSCPWITLVSRL
ncbi:hypothetical protein D9M72_420700 [compost metagenome]